MNPFAALPSAVFFLGLIIFSVYIDVPFPWAPFNMQFFFLLLCILMMSSYGAFLTVGIYLLAGLSGIPVFTHGGGLEYFKETSFGYLLGFLLLSLLTGALLKVIKKRRINLYLFLSVLTLLFVHGSAWLYSLLLQQYVSGAEPFLWNDTLRRLPGEIIMAVGASWTAYGLYHIASPPSNNAEKGKGSTRE